MVVDEFTEPVEIVGPRLFGDALQGTNPDAGCPGNRDIPRGSIVRLGWFAAELDVTPGHTLHEKGTSIH